MRIRRYCIITAALFALIGGGVGLVLQLAVRHAATEVAQAAELDVSQTDRNAIDPEALLARYRQPQEFTMLCEMVRKRNIEIDQRHKSLEHNEASLNIEFDRKGKRIAADRVVERVWFDNGQEHRLLLKREDTLTGQDETPKTRTELTPESPKSTYPFGTNATEGTYKYSLEGYDNVGNRTLLRVGFEPTEPLDGKFRGKFWVDPQNFEPVRFDGAWAKPPAFVDQMTHLLEFGPSENGMTQIRRSVISGSGGFAIIQKRYRIETDLADFRPRSRQ